VTGSNFGLHASHTQAARIGASAAEASDWVSDTQLQCKLATAFRASLRVAVTAARVSGSLTEAVSFDAVALSSVRRTNVHATGSLSVTITGASLAARADYTAVARVGATACEASAWDSDSSIVCRVSGGSLSTRRLMVTAGERGGTMTEAGSYDAPALSITRRVNMPSTGSVRVTVVGASMGMSTYTAAGRVGGTSCEASAWHSDSSVRCLTPGGAKGTMRVALTAGIRAGSVTETISFDLPTPLHAAFPNRPSTGSASMTIFGLNMGLVGYTQEARVGHTACEATGWVGDTAVNCLTASGTGGTLRLAVTAGGRAGSVTDAVSYSIPAVSEMVRTNLPSTGAVSMTIFGLGFGQAMYSPGARMAMTTAEASEWYSDTSLRARSMQGAHGTLRVAITASSLAGSISKPYTPNPKPETLNPKPLNTKH
jgi:hypothetical protein